MIKRFQVTLESFAWGEKEKVGVASSLRNEVKKRHSFNCVLNIHSANFLMCCL